MQKAYILHTRPYTDSKYLIRVFTENDGCFSAVIRLARGKKRQAHRICLNLFQPVFIEWKGAAELKTVIHIEPASVALPLTADALFFGFYLNEVCLRTLQRQEASPQLFTSYHATLRKLAQKDTDPQEQLRYFELVLLYHLGALPDLQHDTHQNPIQSEQFYRYKPLQGFELVNNTEGFSGSMLQALRAQCLTLEHFKPAKHLLQRLLAPFLGAEPLESRTLYMQYQRNKYESVKTRR